MSNARERPPTRAASGLHGCMVARSLDLLPAETNPTPARSSTSSEFRAFAVVRFVYVALVPSHHASHTRKASRRNRIPRVCVRCCSAFFSSVCWTERARACGARAGTGRFITHVRTRQFTTHFITNKPHQTHTSDEVPHTLVPTSNRVVLHEARRHAHPSLPRDRHDATSYHAVARDTKLYRLAQHKASHQRRVARTSTRVLHAWTDLNALFTLCAHPVGYIDEAPLRFPRTNQAHSSHKAARIGSSCALGRVSVFVSVRRFCEDSTDRCPDVSALFVFSQRIRLNGSDVPHACILFGVFGVGNATVHAECVTSGVVRFFVCCATFALSVGLLFQRVVFFFRAMSLRTPCDKFQF